MDERQRIGRLSRDLLLRYLIDGNKRVSEEVINRSLNIITVNALEDFTFFRTIAMVGVRNYFIELRFKKKGDTLPMEALIKTIGQEKIMWQSKDEKELKQIILEVKLKGREKK